VTYIISGWGDVGVHVTHQIRRGGEEGTNPLENCPPEKRAKEGQKKER